MKCKRCRRELQGVTGFDTGTEEESYAWNLKVCVNCGAIARENVWGNPGVVWLFPDSNQAFVGHLYTCHPEGR